MPKTGTSSIQEYLYCGLRDPAFRYVDFGEANGSRGVTTLFGNPETYFYHRQLGLSKQDVVSYRHRCYQRLEKMMAKAATLGQTLILSAESGWHLQPLELRRLREYMENRGYSVKVVVYLRPWKSWLESRFQQDVRAWNHTVSFLVPKSSQVFDYYNRLQILEAVFGSDQVTVCPYHSRSFPDGCVVKDFCHRLGISFNPAQVRRANDSLSLPAIKLLYTYHKLGPGFGVGKWAVLSNNLLGYIALVQLPGPPVRFHSSLVEPLLKELTPQRPWLEQRLGVAFDQDIYQHDEADCIRKEADLFHYDRGSLEWLAAATGRLPSDDPQEVAAQIHHLRYHPTLNSLASALYEKISKVNLGNSLRTLEQQLQRL